MVTLSRWQNAAVAAGAVALLSCGTALGQNNPMRAPGKRNGPVDPNAPLVERVLPKGRTELWILKVDLYYPGIRNENPPADRWGIVRPEFSAPGHTMTQAEWDRINQQASVGVKFDTAAMVFPMPLESAGHVAQMGTFVSKIKIDNKEVAVEPKWTDGYQSGERLGRWELRDVDAKRLNLHLEIPMSCWETFYDEQQAAAVDWPKDPWPAAAKTALEPVYLVEWRDTEQEIATAKTKLDTLIKGWLNGRDPKTIKPAVLAKELAGRTMEYCNPSMGTSAFGRMAGTFQGVITKTVSEVIDDKRCYDLDVPAFLSAVYRNVGIPARTVYGYDMSDQDRRSSGPPKLHCWVEFALMDPKSHAAVWIPVDVVKMRWSGSRMQRMDRAWEYFGRNEDMPWMLPISFHVHPPTGVVVRSLPAFWGWLCTPETPPYPHTLTFDASGQNSRQIKKNERDKKP